MTTDRTDDVPRNDPSAGEPRRALIGDPRNDENIVVSQLHLAFMKFHNAVVDALAGTADGDLFDEACRVVRWHYQWVVVHDFLRRIVGGDVVDDILAGTGDTYAIATGTGARHAALPKVGLRFYRYRRRPYMPVEFSAAAYRFGHSMIRPFYDLNTVVGGVSIFSTDDQSELSDLRGFRERPARWEIEWDRFFPFPGATGLQHSRLIDSALAPGLDRLPPNLDPHGTSLACSPPTRCPTCASPPAGARSPTPSARHTTARSRWSSCSGSPGPAPRRRCPRSSTSAARRP